MKLDLLIHLSPSVKIFFKSSLMPFCPGFHEAGHASPYSLTYCKGTDAQESRERLGLLKPTAHRQRPLNPRGMRQRCRQQPQLTVVLQDPQASHDICIRRLLGGHARHSMVTGRRHCSRRGTANLQSQQHPQYLVHVPANLSIIHQLQVSH